MTIANIEVPKIGFWKLCTCVTQKGRQNLVRQIVAPFTKLDAISTLMAEGAATAIDLGTNKLTDQRCSQIAAGCQALETCSSLIKKSIAPDGDGGKKFTESEKQEMKIAIDWGISNILTQEAIDEKINQLIKKVP